MARLFPLSLVSIAAAFGCAAAAPAPAPKPNMDPGALPPAESAARRDSSAMPAAPPPSAPPDEAFRNGWMPLGETGVDAFIRTHPTFDGRGVLIAVLDSGIDPGIAGLGRTSTGERKVLDLRDFSREGLVVLTPLSPRGDTVQVGGQRLAGFGRVAALASGSRSFGGVLRELPLGEAPAADVNGNGSVGDSLPVVVALASDGWVLFADTDGDGSLANERPIHDYLTGHDTFAWSTAGRPAPLNIAVNFADAGEASPPTLDLFFDTSGHGSHVSGIAAGHDMYGIRGFDGVAPGAFLLECKIADDAQGGITTTASMIRALAYAIGFAAARHLPLVVNMSFGVGNESEGAARIDAILDSALAAHPEVTFTVSAGNDGPGLSTVGFPGSAARVITVGATLPSTFLTAAPGQRPAGPLAFFSARGGELAKPDIVTPGMAYSTVPRWDVGGERENGTSMASPHAAGLVALLISAAAPRRLDAATVRQALMVTARPSAGSTFLDEGAGLPDVGRAFRWLQSARTAEPVDAFVSGRPGRSAAYQAVTRGGLADTVVTFMLRPARVDTFRLRASAPWLHAPDRVIAGPAAGAVRLTYDSRAFAAPGVYSAVVTGWRSDTQGGPAFRLVNTVVIAHPAGRDVTLRLDVPGGGVERVFFTADSGRPFSVRGSSAADGATLYLHEPGGMPYRDGTGLPIGTGPSSAVFDVGGREALGGTYEIDAVAPPLDRATVSLDVRQAPLTLQLMRDRAGLQATLINLTAAPVAARAAVVLIGAEWTQPIIARGSEPQRVPFIVPAWARGVVIEVAMAPTEWERFTDLGLTLFDSAGGQIAKEPLNYALGRLQVPLPPGHGAMRVELALFPGFADERAAADTWTARTTIRLYADSAVSVPGADGTSPVAMTLGPRAAATARFPFRASPWLLGDGFIPMGAVVAETGGMLWTREAGLPVPAPPVMR